MFDIRVASYTSGADTERADFWGTDNQMVASFHTLRTDHDRRHERSASMPQGRRLREYSRALNPPEHASVMAGAQTPFSDCSLAR